MIRRAFNRRLERLLGVFPAVCLLGPRQCGKTTFIRSSLPHWRYLDMEKPSDAARFHDDPERALADLDKRFILDEAQRVPELFPMLRGHLDGRSSRKGRLVLLGSASPSLIAHISETLAGRVGFLEMTPFLWSEVAARRADFTLDNLWLRGGFPDAFRSRDRASRYDWHESYTKTFIERDLAALGLRVSAADMRKLWGMLAHFNGGLWNASTLAASLGVNYHTVDRYASILEQTFLVRFLRPYYVNLGKRLVKSPKVYFRDTGLLHYFLGIGSTSDLGVHPSRGASWEAFIIEQTASAFQLLAPDSRAYFWRTAAGAETDLLMVRGRRRTAFEIKLSRAPRLKDVAGLTSCMRDLKLDKGYVLYPGKDDYSLGCGVRALAVEPLLKNPARLLSL